MHLRVLYISTFILRLGFGALLIIISNYVPGATPYDRLLNVAIVAVPYPLAEMATANYFGIKSDQLGRKKIIVAGTTLAAVVVVLYTFSNNVVWLGTMHGLHGIGAAATVAPAIAMIADHADSHDRGRQMGWFDYSTLLGYIFGAVLGGFAILYPNTASLLLIAGLLFLSAFLLWKFVLKEAPKGKATVYGNWHALRKVFKVKEIREVFPIWLIIAILLGLALTYLPIILLSANVSGPVIGLAFAAAGTALGLLQPFWGRVSDRFGRTPVMLYGILSITGIVIILLLFPSAVFTQDALGKFHFGLGIIPLAICGLGAGAFVPSALAMMADFSSEESYGATMGLYSFALGFGAFVAEGMGLAIILVAKSEQAPIWLLYFAAILVFAALILVLFFFARKTLTRSFGREAR